MRQHRTGLVGARGRVRHRVRRARRQEVLVARAGDRRAIRIHRHRQRDRGVEVGAVAAGRRIPPAPHHRVAAWHQEGVGELRGVGDRARIIAAVRRAVQRLPGLAAAIGRLVHHLVRALGEIDRLQDVEVERVLDVAVGVARRELDVGDAAVLGIGRADFAVGLARDLLVLADAGPRVAAERRRLVCGHGDLGDARLDGRRRGERAAGGERGDDACAQPPPLCRSRRKLEQFACWC